MRVLKYHQRVVATTLDLYFKGVSLRKIADHLKQFYGLDIDHSMFYRWISKYTEVISEYIAALEPDVGDIWHTDEMNVKIGGEWQWLWNVMDERTRFHLVSVITQEQGDKQECEEAFQTVEESSWKEAQSYGHRWLTII